MAAARCRSPSWSAAISKWICSPARWREPGRTTHWRVRVDVLPTGENLVIAQNAQQRQAFRDAILEISGLAVLLAALACTGAGLVLSGILLQCQIASNRALQSGGHFWALTDQPQISIVARDRGGGYALAAARALPHAVQVADRWHLMENASHAFLAAVRGWMRHIRGAVGTMTVNPDLLTAAERIQYEGYLRREDTNAAILTLAGSGQTIKAIVRSTGCSRGLVRKILRGQRSDVFRVRENSLEPYLPWLDAEWTKGHHNAAALWRRLKGQGFRGSLRVVSEWATRRRRADRIGAETLQRVPAARTMARLLTIGRDTLSKSETFLIAAIEAGVPLLVEAREIIAAFHAMLRRKAERELDAWIDRAKGSLVASFANGVIKDKAAVRAAISSSWSNGQTEGQITKLKLVKRQMYGRAKLDLLEARLLGAN